ncbi:zinc-binding dehydrogenase [Frankia sp. R82]|uniref:zinc-binding dehydrogenase n=1 Tax=Frankia sp. R82 TaxID=2950553 RepID=UPI002044389F|nr:zinc-binding dehydrogenase [Frankia sp. R82]MCM3887194.1 zinc-binding dehydrogenase [Frankia sp. R82]
MTRGLELYASAGRWAAGRAAARVSDGSGRWGGPAAVGRLVALRLVDGDDPVPPDGGWVRVRPSLAGIGGADLALVTGGGSGYVGGSLRLPFVPGREVVGRVQEAVELAGGAGVVPAGGRVVVDAGWVQRAAARLAAGPGCGVAGSAGVGTAEVAVAGGVVAAGGGWSRVMVAPRVALRAVPEAVPDGRAVLFDPLSRAVAAVAAARVAAGARVLVVGAGAVGLATVLAVRAFTEAGSVTVVTGGGWAAGVAGRFGASAVVEPAAAVAGVRRATRVVRVAARGGEDFLLGGVDVAFEASGRASGVSLAARTTRVGGRVVLVGVPSGRVDLTPVWARGLTLVGASGDGTMTSEGVPSDGDEVGSVGGRAGNGPARVWELAADPRLDEVVGVVYPLSRWREAVDHALRAHQRGVVRVAFDPAVGG